MASSRCSSWCRQLLSFYHDRDRDSADVKAIAEAKLAEIDRKIAELVLNRKPPASRAL
ncbi:MerR family DNA-binding protein [Mesorhizobium kowhaii]|uniref:MerR family DNA-binding protein n=1 Tax=Mesorhizobium kowhaii TaxID=1300272 RepID=UPI003CCB1E3D